MSEKFIITFLLFSSIFTVLSFAEETRGSAPPTLSEKQIEQDWFVQQNRRFAFFAQKESDARPNLSSAQLTLQRGLRLAKDLQDKGVRVESAILEFHNLEKQLQEFPAEKTNADAQNLYLESRRTVRRLAWQNPQLDFDSILFVKRKPGMLPHLSDQYYGWWSQPGGGIFILERFKSDNPTLRSLTEKWPEGTFLRPDLSYDGQKVLFAYCRYYPEVEKMEKVDKSQLPEDCFFHIYEMNIDGSNVKKLTHGRYDDFDARYLPDGDIVFLSTRKGQFIQCSMENTERTLSATLPDSYVRCGGDNVRPCAVYTLHRMSGNGANMRPISAFETFEYNPSVMNDGRILYTRWDYIDRFNGHFFSLWSTRQDGTHSQLVYGNYTVRPQATMEARAVPQSNKILFTASAHHSHNGGSLVLLDTRQGNENDSPITRLTPEVPFPETEANLSMYYASPYPLSENYYLTAWSAEKLPPHWGSKPVKSPENPANALGIYLYDSFGNLELLYRDPSIASLDPIPVRPRVKPPVHPSTVDWKGKQEGSFLISDIYQGLEGVPKGSIKQIRIVGVLPKPQPHMNQPCIGVSEEDPGKFVLGTVPVEPDGSAFFAVPSGVPVFFQALDEKGMAVQTMRSLTYVQPGETLSCVGCHESRFQVPSAIKVPLASRRDPSKIRSGPSGSWPLRFGELVQPVLDQSCVRCHSSQGTDPKAAQFDLTPEKSYQNLLAYADRDLAKLAFEKDRSIPGDCVARKSRLTQVLSSTEHTKNVELDEESWERLITWMDVYAHKEGSFSPKQEEDLVALRKDMAGILQK